MNLNKIIPKGFYLGATSNYKLLKDDCKLQDLVANNFNLITSDNDFKLTRVARYPSRWDFEGSDWFVNYASDSGLKVRGHLMIPGGKIPKWLNGMDSKQFRRFLKSYFKATLIRYPSITDWDVCGECFDDNGTIRRNFLSERLGNDWVKTCLTWAREFRPDAKLFYSEYRLQGYRKQKSVIKLINECQLEGNVLDGLGVQLHHNTLGTFRLFGFKDFLKTIRERGLIIHFSEVTLWSNTALSEQFGNISQAVAYSELLRLCQESGSSVFNVWGTTDRYSWRNPELNPFLFDRDYRPKPAYFAIKQGLTHLRGIMP